LPALDDDRKKPFGHTSLGLSLDRRFGSYVGALANVAESALSTDSGQCLRSSLCRLHRKFGVSGGTITGFISNEPTLGGKWPGLPKEIAPSLERVGFLFDPDTAPYASSFLRETKAAALLLGLKAHLIAGTQRSRAHNC